MRVIRRAAAFAHAFVSLNYEQAAAIKYLAHPASDAGAIVSHTGSSRGQQGGSMTKLVWLGVATMSVVAVAGTPGKAATTPTVFDAVRQFATSVWFASGPALQVPAAASAWSESGSLLLLASGFFTAAVILRRQAR